MNQIYKRKVIFFSNDCIESFRTTRLNTDFKKLPTENFYSAIANNSGPLALLYRKYNAKQLKLPLNYDKHILFFNCKGDLITTRQFDLKQRVILFNFTQDQQLFILYANGIYFLVDPATDKIITGSIFQQNQQKKRCYGAEIVRQSLIVLKQKTIGIVNKIGQFWKILTPIKLNNDFQIFNSHFNTQDQLEIIFYGRKNSIQLFNFNSWRNNQANPITIYENSQTANNISNLVSIAKKNSTIVLIFIDKVTIVKLNQANQIIKSMNINIVNYTIQKEDPLTKSETKSRYKNFYKLGWIQNTIYFYDRIKLLFFSQVQPIYQLKNLSMTNMLSQDDGGLRLMDENTFFLRVINNPIYFSLIDQEKIAQKILQHKKEELQIFNHYKNFQNFYDRFLDKQQAIQIKFVQKIKDNAQQIWQKLLEIAQIYIDPGEQLRALKFARFLKNYYQFDNVVNQVNTLIKQLRVINSLRYQFMNRWITLSQLRKIKLKDNFLKILLRNNMHFVADLMYEDSKSKKKIFDHWARCKIQKQTQSNALEDIKAKYNEMRQDLSYKSVFTELAKYCLDNKERNLTKLASRLIELQNHPGKRCMVVLLIFLSQKDPDNIHRLLNAAQQSGDSSIIHHTLQSLRRISEEWLPIKLWQQILPKKPLLQNYYMRLLKVNNQIEQLQNYLTTNGLYVAMSYMSLGQQLSAKHDITLEDAKSMISSNYSKILVSLDENLAKCRQRKGIKILKQLKNKKYPITQDDAKQLQNDKDLQVLSELIIKKDDNVPLAIHILCKMKSQKVYDLLVKKGKIKNAIEQAFLRKNKQKLIQLISSAEGQIQQLGKQMLNELDKKR